MFDNIARELTAAFIEIGKMAGTFSLASVCKGPGRKTLYTIHKQIGRNRIRPAPTSQPFIIAENSLRGHMRRRMRAAGEMKFQRNAPDTVAKIASDHKRKRRLARLAVQP